jgi:hypothetical protein
MELVFSCTRSSLHAMKCSKIASGQDTQLTAAMYFTYSEQRLDSVIPSTLLRRKSLETGKLHQLLLCLSLSYFTKITSFYSCVLSITAPCLFVKTSYVSEKLTAIIFRVKTEALFSYTGGFYTLLLHEYLPWKIRMCKSQSKVAFSSRNCPRNMKQELKCARRWNTHTFEMHIFPFLTKYLTNLDKTTTI